MAVKVGINGFGRIGRLLADNVGPDPAAELAAKQTRNQSHTP